MSRVVTFGEVMGRLAAPGFKRFQQTMPGTLEVTFAGAEASIAASIAHLGGDAAFVTALPAHAIADACVADLRSLGVDVRHILRTPEGRLGLYFLEHGVNQRGGQVIYDREGSSVAITSPEAYDWDAIFGGADWFVISGITPALSKNAADVALHAVHEAARRGVAVACDMNYRSKLWRWEPGTAPRVLATRIMREMLPYVSLFIGGREDAEEMLGLQGTAETPEGLAREIAQAYPNLRHVAMTLRETLSASHHRWGGFLYEASTGRDWRAPMQDGSYRPYEITHMVDRLGGGDAFTAGLLFAFGDDSLQGPDRALSFAVAAGCLAHSIEGDYNYVTRAEVEALMTGDASGRVRR